jgi:hypothetical protein
MASETPNTMSWHSDILPFKTRLMQLNPSSADLDTGTTDLDDACEFKDVRDLEAKDLEESF